MDTTTRHITVCVCTFKRPALLRKLLAGLEHQQTEGLFSYSVVVCDNDLDLSAEQTVAAFQDVPGFDVTYVVEPEQSIARARNTAIRNAKGDFIATIDDDELPPSEWLLRLLTAYDKYKADGILGPVLPHYEGNPPEWIIKGGFHDRPSHETGTVLEWWNTRTGNTLLRMGIFEGEGGKFRPEYSDGSEDTDFFRRMVGKGRRFVWCAEAPVTEVVPRERCTRSYLIKRSLQRGAAPPYSRGFVLYFKPLIAAPLYTLLLPFLLFTPHHIFMKCLVKDCHHIGRIGSFLGLKVIKKGHV